MAQAGRNTREGGVLLSLPAPLILTGHTYRGRSHTSHSSTHPSPVSPYRRILDIGPQTTLSPRRPDRHATGPWVRYETLYNGLRLVRSCSRKSFARWAEEEVEDGELVMPMIVFEEESPMSVPMHNFIDPAPVEGFIDG